MAEEQDGDLRLFGLYIGVVVKRDDPLKLGRVKVRVPGLLEPTSGWCWPLGAGGAGTKQRGSKWTPKVGAEVGVLFNQGDVDNPYYFTGHWGIPGGVTETPGRNIDPDTYLDPGVDPAEQNPEREMPEAETPDVHVMETDNYLVAIDERPASPNDVRDRFLFRHKPTGDFIEYDGPGGGGWTIKGTTLIRLLCDGLISIEANQVQIQERTVVESDNPI